MTEPIYRLLQGLRTLVAFLHPLDLSEATHVLTPPLMALFNTMRRSERLHGLRVMKTLISQGYTQPDLLVAALLHDVGKARYPYTLPERALVVLASAVAPRLCARWGQGEPRGWRKPFVIAAKHPIWSAESLREVGASPLAVELAGRHQTLLDGEPQSEVDRLLALLQAADGVG